MPGTEYQFRLRAYSNGCWQAREESIVSSPFKTVCSPPDAPPACPRTRQLGSDPLVPGGLADAGALLSPSKTAGAYGRSSRNGGVSGGGGLDGRVAGAAAAAAAAAVDRGKAHAEAEWERGGGGGVGYDHGGWGSGNDEADSKGPGMGEVGGGGPLRSNGTDGEGEADGAVEGGDYRERRTSGSRGGGRRGTRHRQEAGEREEEEEDGESKQEEGAARNKEAARTKKRSSGDGAGKMLLLPPLSDATVDRGDGAREESGQEVDGGEDGSAAAETEGADSKGSTTIVLDWDAGCSNGSITTNYEVRKSRAPTRTKYTFQRRPSLSAVEISRVAAPLRW